VDERDRHDQLEPGALTPYLLAFAICRADHGQRLVDLIERAALCLDLPILHKPLGTHRREDGELRVGHSHLDLGDFTCVE